MCDIRFLLFSTHLANRRWKAKMEITKPLSRTPVASIALVVAAIFAVSIAIVPVGVAATSGSAYPMEIIRAHTVYKVTDPAGMVLTGLGVHGNR